MGDTVFHYIIGSNLDFSKIINVHKMKFVQFSTPQKSRTQSLSKMKNGEKFCYTISVYFPFFEQRIQEGK